MNPRCLAQPGRRVFVRLRKMDTMNTPPSWTTIVLATCRASDNPDTPRVIGFALLTCTKLARADWRFELIVEVAPTLDDETALLRILADALPHATYVICEYLERDVFTPLGFTADRAPPPLNAFLQYRLARFRSAICIDLAPPTRRASPLPFAEPRTGRSPLIVSVSGYDVLAVDAVRSVLEDRALSLWMQFLKLPIAVRCGTAGLATLTWASAEGLVR